MKTTIVAVGAVLFGTLFASAEARAQVFTPSYMSPVPMSDLGIYVSEGPGDLTLEGIWRAGALGLRAGFVDTNGDDLLSVGGEFRNPLPVASAPLSLAFTLGGQGLLGENSAIGLQAGLSAGGRFVQPGIAITPYIHPRIAFINGFGVEDDFNAEVLADLGVDLEFARNLVFRLGVGLSDETADWGIGLAWRR